MITSIPAFAQDADDAQDNTRDNTRVVNTISRDRVIFELNYTGWLEAPSSPDVVETKWYNRGVNLFLMWDIPLGDKNTSNWAFAPGLGISNHNVYSNARPRLFLDNERFGESYFETIPDNLDVRNNKLSTVHLEAPMELRYRTKPNKLGFSWKVNVGMRFAYLLQSNAKYKGGEVLQVENEDGTFSDQVLRVKVKELNVENLSQYRFGPSLRIGYGNVSLTGYMSLSDLFEKGQGPEIQTFSLGVTFNSF